MSPTRVVELAVGAVAVVVPVAASHDAVALAAVGLVALFVVATRSSAAARTAVACSIVGNAFVFDRADLFSASLLLWADGVALLVFLAVGGLAEAGVRDLAQLARAGAGPVGIRVGLGAVGVAVVVAATWFAVWPSIWLVFAAMAAGTAVLGFASRQSS